VVDLAEPPTVHVVSAAYRDRLEAYTWWFPIVGRVAYKGFFSRDPAVREAEKLEAKGFDTYVRTAAAFSTLGWFADPLFPHLLNYDEVSLANVVFHELFHGTFYLSGHTAFSESLANFAAGRAAVEFFRSREGETGEKYRQALAAWEDELRFSAFLGDAARRLEACYRASASREEALRAREEIFAELKEDFARLDFRSGRNGDFARERLNNAVLLHYLLYRRELGVFEALYRSAGGDLRETLRRAIALAKDADDPFAALREAVAQSPSLSATTMPRAARRLHARKGIAS
jgi:predicted aminopeptidase